MLLRSIACRAPTPAALGAEFAKEIAAAGAPDALLWLTDASDAAFVARAAADACGAAVGARTAGGLVGGGREHYGPPEGQMRPYGVIVIAWFVSVCLFLYRLAGSAAGILRTRLRHVHGVAYSTAMKARKK